MKVDLSKYSGMNICVAVSGGRDSMALLHYLLAHCGEYGIAVSALNCEHGLRGEDSVCDSEFVKNYCKTHTIPTKCYSADCNALAKERGESVETAARNWRRECYADAAKHFNAVIATAHHLSDNAETVIFNLARGSGLSGVAGIADTDCTFSDGKSFKLIRPLIACSRTEIDTYVAKNAIPFVEDATNFSDDYTRNYIRHNVLPELEKAVHGAEEAIFRFSRLAARDEEYLSRTACKNFLKIEGDTAFIMHCDEIALFSRAALAAVAGHFCKKDYTAEQLETLYNLQFLEVGKTFEFLNLTAYKEEGKIAICPKNSTQVLKMPFGYGQIDFGGISLIIEKSNGKGGLAVPQKLHFDFDKVPNCAIIRTRRAGDRFTKFGGGTKSLGEFLTDRKIPMRVRNSLPVIAVGNEVLAICGVEISDKIKVDDGTKNKCTISFFWC